MLACCIMLGSMSHELQKQREHMDAPLLSFIRRNCMTRMEGMRGMRPLGNCSYAKTTGGMSYDLHVLKMIVIIKKLEGLGFTMDSELIN